MDGDINRAIADAPGNGDGNVDQQDLFWYDQFSRGLHCPSDSPYNEFQRLDGNDNGSIDGGDYTYITNVFLGISAKVAANGPAAKPPNLCFGVPTEDGLGGVASLRSDVDEEVNNAPREMLASSAAGQPGRDVYVYLTLDAAGDERSTSTSVHWDPAVMTIDQTSGINLNPDVESGPGAVSGQLIGVNANGVSNGDLGVLIDFSGGSGDAAPQAGPRQVIRLRFHIRPEARIGSSTTIEFGGGVVAQQTVDTSGRIAAIRQYTVGRVTVVR